MINPPNFGSLQQQASQNVLELRAALQKIAFFEQYLLSLGKANLVALGFSSEDADLLLSVYGHLNAVAKMCTGSAYAGPGLPFDFIGETTPLWSGS